MSEFVFQGESALTLDGKGRVTVPARFRDALASLCTGRMTVTKHPFTLPAAVSAAGLG